MGLMLFRAYYWLRFFDKTAHFVQLILGSMYEIRHFFLLFAGMLVVFGVPFYFLGKSRDSHL